jgi:large subunit ribosomal protein L17
MTTSHRQAMFRNMVTSLLKHERIRTTDTRAKELRRWADHIITLAKRGDLHARRQALAIVREKDVVHKLFEEADKRFGSINGGYTRVVKIGRRPGDAALMSIIELVSGEEKPKKKKKKAKAEPAKASPAAQAAVRSPEAGKDQETAQTEAAKDDDKVEAPETQATDADGTETPQAAEKPAVPAEEAPTDPAAQTAAQEDAAEPDAVPGTEPGASVDEDSEKKEK